jgi:hypothetical protein
MIKAWVAGTLVADDELLLQAFRSALDAAGVEGEHLDKALRYALATMGQAKLAVLEDCSGNPPLLRPP